MLVFKLISPYLGVSIVITETIIILLTLYSFQGEMPPVKVFGKIKGVAYVIGISLLMLYSIKKIELLLYISEIFVYLGLSFAILSPILYLKEQKEKSSKKKHQVQELEE